MQSYYLFILFIIFSSFFCRTLNDANENEEISKCREGLLYNLSITQTSNQWQIFLYDYQQCLKQARKERVNPEIPL